MADAGVEATDMEFAYLEKITNNFSKELGKGAFATVYEGVDRYGGKIAVKKLHETYGIDDKKYLEELQIMKKLQHKNIVRLVGYCSAIEEVTSKYEGKYVVAEKRHRALCLEHMPNGNLRAILLSGGRDKYNWQTCYGIISGICQGLNYLHYELKPPVFHLDLKPANILLDEKMVPRIADFGISRLLGEDERTRLTENRVGTPGYLPPEFLHGGEISEKFDIFSLGVVITRMMAGHDRYLETTEMSSHEAIKLVLEYWTSRILEPWYRENAYCKQVKECIEIGLSCLEHDRKKRPTIEYIVGRLKMTETECDEAVKKEELSISKVAKLDRLNGPARLMVVSNLDYTMVDDKDEENLSLLRFGALWESAYRQDSLLVYSTGRSSARYEQLKKDKPMLPTPDITIMSVGTEITYGEAMVPDDGWKEYLNNNMWNRNIVDEVTKNFPGLTPQGDTEQRPHKLSFYVKEEYDSQEVKDSLSKNLEERGVYVKMISSAGRALDILAKGAGKGQALAYLLKKLGSFGKTPKDTLVCGDSSSDAELFGIPDVHGVMVSNAEEELLQWYAAKAKDNHKVLHATERCAAGIIQAIRHFELGRNVSPRDVMLPYVKEDSFKPTEAVVKFYVLYEQWRGVDVRNADVPNADFLKGYFENVTDANGIIIHPNGLVLGIHAVVASRYGDKQGKKYRSWVDGLVLSQTASDRWLVWFDSWESEGDARACCFTTFELNVKPETPEGFVVTQIHHTRPRGYSVDELPSLQ